MEFVTSGYVIQYRKALLSKTMECQAQNSYTAKIMSKRGEAMPSKFSVEKAGAFVLTFF